MRKTDTPQVTVQISEDEIMRNDSNSYEDVRAEWDKLDLEEHLPPACSKGLVEVECRRVKDDLMEKRA